MRKSKTMLMAGAGLAMLGGVLTMSVGGALAATPPDESSGGVTLMDGTVTCGADQGNQEGLGYDFGVKFEVASLPGVGNSATLTSANPALSVTVVRNSLSTISFSNASPALSAVVMKGSDESNVYRFDPAATAGGPLATPVNSSGGAAEISHVSFCWNVPETTTTTAPEETTTTAPEETTTTAPEETTTTAPEETTTTLVDVTTTVPTDDTTTTTVEETTTTTPEETTTTVEDTTTTTPEDTTTTEPAEVAGATTTLVETEVAGATTSQPVLAAEQVRPAALAITGTGGLLAMAAASALMMGLGFLLVRRSLAGE